MNFDAFARLTQGVNSGPSVPCVYPEALFERLVLLKLRRMILVKPPGKRLEKDVVDPTYSTRFLWKQKKTGFKFCSLTHTACVHRFSTHKLMEPAISQTWTRVRPYPDLGRFPVRKCCSSCSSEKSMRRCRTRPLLVCHLPS